MLRTYQHEVDVVSSDEQEDEHPPDPCLGSVSCDAYALESK